MLDRIDSGRKVSFEREVFPSLVGKGSTAIAARGLLDGHRDARSATSRPRATSSRAPDRRRARRCSHRAERGRPRGAGPCAGRRGMVEIARTRRVGPDATLGDGGRGRGRARRRRAGVLHDGVVVARRAPVVRDSIVGRVPRIGAGDSRLGRRRRSSARGVVPARVGAHLGLGGRCPADGSAARRLDWRAHARPDAGADRVRRRSGRWTTCWRCRSTSRTRSGASSRPRSRACSGSSRRPGPLLVCGMGGSAIGGDLAGGILGERLPRPLQTVRGYELPLWATPSSVVLCASYSGNTEETLACYEAAGALGAIADRGHDRRPARRGRPRRRRAGDPAAGRAPAARGRRLHARRGARGGGALRRRAAREDRDRRCRVVARGPRRELGPGRRLRQPREASRAAGQQDLRVRLRRRADGADRHRWKTQINENAKVPAFWAELPGGRPQRDRGLGGRGLASAASWPCSSRTPTSTRACASASS